MRVLVTGGAGFIGSALARRLRDDGAEVRVLDSLITGFSESVPEDVEFIHEDLRNLDALRAACDGVDVVFHQAALRSVPRSVDDPVLTNECNVTGTLNLLIAAADAGATRLVYASSSSVYGDTSGTVNTEGMTPQPMSPYAVSKLAAEQYCAAWAKLDRLSTVSLRYFNVFGPGQHPESKYAAVFPAFISALAAGRPPEVHWDGEQSRDFTYIDDVVDANLKAATTDASWSGVVNIGGGRPKSVNEVLRAVASAMDRWLEPVARPKRAGDVRETRADITRAAEILGWTPRADWDDSVRATVDWFARSYGSGDSNRRAV